MTERFVAESVSGQVRTVPGQARWWHVRDVRDDHEVAVFMGDSAKDNARWADEYATWANRRAEVEPCTCPDGVEPWEPEWDGTLATDPACPWHGGGR